MEFLIRLDRACLEVCRFVVGGLVALSCMTDLSVAQDRDWAGMAYPYTVVDQDVQDALTELGRNLNVSVQVSEVVEGRLRGPWSSSTVEGFLNRVAADLDIEWFFDGRLLHVSASDESVRQLLSLNGVEPSAWQASLDHLGISNERFPVNIDSAQNIAFVSGPPKFVELVMQSLPPAVTSAPEGRVNVIHGRPHRGGAS